MTARAVVATVVAALVAASSACGGSAGNDAGDRPLDPHVVAQIALEEHGDCVLTDVRFPFGEGAGDLLGFCVVEPDDDDPYVACTTFADADGRAAEEIEFHGAEETADIRLTDWETPGCGRAVRWARPWLEERLGV